MSRKVEGELSIVLFYHIGLITHLVEWTEIVVGKTWLVMLTAHQLISSLHLSRGWAFHQYRNASLHSFLIFVLLKRESKWSWLV